jgi:DNA-directed RNA polymerase specialized sigma24 family protein
MENDTDGGRERRRFPATSHSMVEGARSLDPEERRHAWERVVQAYWKPAYVYLRLRRGASAEDAEDLTQGFFARAFEKRFFDGFDPARARFRTFLRTCLDGYAANQRAVDQRLKRGGGAIMLPLDFATAERDLPPLSLAAGEDPDAAFHREWLRVLCADAVDVVRRRCRESGRELALAVFERCDLSDLAEAERPSYATLAAEFAIPLTQVTNLLSSARREFRSAMLETVRARTASDEEFEEEARRLLGRESP